jgi:hypothetical protein
MHAIRRFLSVAPMLVLVLASLGGLGGCAGLFGPPVVTLTQSDLDRLVQRNFPVERRLLEVFEVSVNTPRLRLLPERNRLAAVFDLHARDRLFGGQWQGRLDVDAVLRWEPADQTLRLAQVRVQDLALNSTGAQAQGVATRLGAALAERVLEDMSVWHLPPEKADELKRRGLEPGAVTVTSRGVEITFQALAR